MSFPFGFGPGSGGNPDDPSGNPFGELGGAMPLFAELQKLLSWSGGPVNWDLAQQLAASSLAGANEPVATADAKNPHAQRFVVLDRSADGVPMSALLSLDFAWGQSSTAEFRPLS